MNTCLVQPLAFVASSDIFSAVDRRDSRRIRQAILGERSDSVACIRIGQFEFKFRERYMGENTILFDARSKSPDSRWVPAS